MAGIIESIYWDQSSAKDFVYKHPKNDITLGSTLIVRESQEAYFYVNGVLCDKFEAGRYRLSTQNLPLLNRLVNLVSGGKSTFLAEVWFVSKLEKRNMLWGTGGMRIVDPYFQIPIKVSSRGQYGFRIDDGAMFLKKMIGTLGFGNSDLILKQFRVDVVEGVRVAVAKYMKENNININDVASEYRSIGSYIRLGLQESFDEYGIELLNFNIEDINIDENDKGYQKVMDGIAENARLSKLGIDYRQQKQIDIAQAAASNEGAGNFMGVGMGFGAGQQLGQVVSNSFQQSGMVAPPPPPPSAQFYVAENGQTTGPFDMNQIQNMITNNKIRPKTYVFRVGGNAWVEAEKESEIQQLFASMTLPPPPPQESI